jgi:sugar phosphate isomerase/epimerase
MLLSSNGWVRGGEPGVTNAFFVACEEADPSWPRTYEATAVMAKELGYDGMGLLYLHDLSERLRAFDSVGLRVSQIVLNVCLGESAIMFDGAPFDPRLSQDLSLLKGRGVQLVLTIYDFKPSDRGVYRRAIKIIREIADLAAPETEVLLSNSPYSVSKLRVEDVLRLANDTGRPNVGIMFNLFYYLADSKDHDYRPVLEMALPRLKAVEIVGTDEFPIIESRCVKPLGRGSFDMGGFLKTLREVGYTGPIIYQTHLINGDVKTVLKESMKAWHTLQSKLNVTQ